MVGKTYFDIFVSYRLKEALQSPTKGSFGERTYYKGKINQTQPQRTALEQGEGKDWG